MSGQQWRRDRIADAERNGEVVKLTGSRSIATPGAGPEIPADIVEKCGHRVTQDVTTSHGYGLLFGFDAEQARLAVEYGPRSVAEYVMSGDLDLARIEAQRVALARDALPTEAERSAISYKDRLARALANVT